MRYILRSAQFLTRKWVLTLLTILLAGGILFFGLRPLTWPNYNQVNLAQGGGLAFHAPGIAYVKKLPGLTASRASGEFSICLTVSPARQHPGFRPLLMLHDGSDHNQLTIAQWNSSIIAMNGDDYSYRRKLPRIVGDDVLSATTTHSLGLASGSTGTRLYANGLLLSARSNLQLSIPPGNNPLYLTLGNSVYGNASWEGILHRLVIYPAALSDLEMAKVCAPAAPNASPGSLPPALRYNFAGLVDGRVVDLSGNGQDLQVPSRPLSLRQVFLAPPWVNFMLSRDLLIDIVLNFFGFMPLGGALYARLRLSSAFSRWYPGLATALICFLLSLGIELVQGWMPNRTSSILDLLLNTAGAVSGTLMLKFAWQRLRHGVAMLADQ